MHRYTGETTRAKGCWKDAPELGQVFLQRVISAAMRISGQCLVSQFLLFLFSQLRLQVCLSAALWTALQWFDIENNKSSATGFHPPTSKQTQMIALYTAHTENLKLLNTCVVVFQASPPENFIENFNIALTQYTVSLQCIVPVFMYLVGIFLSSLFIQYLL